MAGTALTTDPAAAAATAGTGTSNSASAPSPAQALAGLATTFSTLLAAPVTPENQAERNAEVAKLRDQMVQIQADIDAENTRLAGLQVEVRAETERLRTEGWQLEQRRNASDVVHKRRHRSRLPANLEPQTLPFTTPQGTLLRDPSTGSPVTPPYMGGQPTAGHAIPSARQPQLEPDPRHEAPPHHFLTPAGHFTNSVDNLVAATTNLAALPIMGQTPIEIAALNSIKMLKTVVVQ